MASHYLSVRWHSQLSSLSRQLGHHSCLSISVWTAMLSNVAFWSEPSCFASGPSLRAAADQPEGDGAGKSCGLISHSGFPGLFMNHRALMQKNFSGSGSHALKSKVCTIPYTTQYQLKAELNHTSVRKLTRSLKKVCQALRMWMHRQIWSVSCLQPRITQTSLLSVQRVLHLRISLGLAHTYPCLCFSPLKHSPGFPLERGTNMFCKYHQTVMPMHRTF